MNIESRKKNVFIYDSRRNKWRKMKIHSSIPDINGIIHRWVFDFELAVFNRQQLFSVERLMHNWWWLSIPYALLYIIAIFIGQLWMAKRNRKFELRKLLVMWNFMLAIFSFWGTCRCVPELIYALTHQGFLYSICHPNCKQGITGLWWVDKSFVKISRQILFRGVGYSWHRKYQKQSIHYLSS